MDFSNWKKTEDKESTNPEGTCPNCHKEGKEIHLVSMSGNFKTVYCPECKSKYDK